MSNLQPTMSANGLPARQILTDRDLLMILMEKVQEGYFGPYEYVQFFCGHTHNPIQVILRDKRSLLIELVNVNRDGRIVWGKSPFV